MIEKIELTGWPDTQEDWDRLAQRLKKNEDNMTENITTLEDIEKNEFLMNTKVFNSIARSFRKERKEENMIESKKDSFEEAVNELLWYAEATHICSPIHDDNIKLLNRIMQKHKEAFIERWNPCKKEEK